MRRRRLALDLQRLRAWRDDSTYTHALEVADAATARDVLAQLREQGHIAYIRPEAPDRIEIIREQHWTCV